MPSPAAALPHDLPPPSLNGLPAGRSASEAWRGALARGVGSSLAAAICVGLADVGLTLKGADDVSGKQALAFGVIILSLYAAAGLVAGVLEGVVAGAVSATHPDGTIGRLWSRLRSDEAIDRSVTAGILAACVTGAAFAVVAARLSIRLVGEPERKTVGALLLGGALAASLPIFALLFYPAYRVAIRVAGIVPRVAGIPRAVVALGALLGGGTLLAIFYVTTRLDWRVLPLAVPSTIVVFVALQIAFLIVTRGRRFGRVLLIASVLAAILAPIVSIAAIEPDERTVALFSLEARGGRTLVAIARSFFDRDGDGYSTILGGGDCDDSNPDIHPGAFDIPDNGIDENCIGGDAHKEPTSLPNLPSVLPPTAESLAAQFHWKGNIVIIAVDTLRADRLGVAGYLRRGGKSLTPRIDELANAGVYFKHVYAQAPNTPRSFPSIFTSRYPSRVKWDNVFRNYPNLTAEAVTLFDALRGAELHTVGESSHFYFTEERGITKGFDEYDNEGAKSIKDSNHDTAAPRIAPRAKAKIAELARKPARFALFVHYFEPHSTYMEHPELPIREKGLEGLEEKYDYEIAFVDRYVGEVVDSVKAAGIADDTMIVVLSDHGEAFGAHSYGGEKMFFHGQTLYDELLRVPLIFVVPGVPHRVVDQPVMLLDLAPTLVDAVKGKAPPSFQGRSLLPAILGEPLAPRPVHAELLPAPEWNHDAKALVDGEGRWKIIYRISDNLFELYDLSVDPTEQKNLIHDQKHEAEQMKHAITKWMESELQAL